LDLPKLRANPRFKALVKKCKCEFEAFGMLACFYEVAQDYWAHDKLVPKDEFHLGDYHRILEVGLAIEEENGIYAKGGAERFAWLKERVDAGRKGGRKSAEVRREKYGTTQPVSTEANPKQSFDSPEAKFKQTRSKTNPTSTVTVTSTSLKIPVGLPKPRSQNQVIAFERSMEKRSIGIADKLMGVFRKHGGDEVGARDELPSWVWNMIENRWNHWEAFCIEASNAFKSGKATFFQHQLRESIAAALLLTLDANERAT
jgi:hypothetical protein